MQNTDYQNNSEEIAGMLRFGTVTAVNNEKRTARVQFPDMGMISDWIPVLINRDFIPDYQGTQRTENTEHHTQPCQVCRNRVQPPASDCASCREAFASHNHELKIKPYMPKVNDMVVCLYEPIRNGRGVVLGGVKPWQ